MITLVLVGRALLESDPLEDIEARLPRDTAVLVAVHRLPELARTLRAFSGDRLPASLEEVRQKFKGMAGFDPFDEEGWRTSGLDPRRAWALASQDASEPDHALILLIPVTDESKAVATLRTALTKSGDATVEEAKEGGRTVWRVREEGRTDAAFAFDGGLLVAVATVKPDTTPEAALTRLLEQSKADALGARPEYQALKRNAGDGWNLFAYGSSEALRERLAETEQQELSQKLGTRGLAGTLALDEQRLHGRLVALQDANARASKLYRRGRDTLGERIGGTAIAAGRASFELKELYAIASEGREREAKEARERTEERYGIDVEKDVLENFTGQLSAAVLENGGQGLLPVDVVAWAPVKDPARTAGLVAKLVEKAK
ncbi:MAG: hypothetical protein ACK4N5_22780, partial [Myxococcales bacterium]